MLDWERLAENVGKRSSEVQMEQSIQSVQSIQSIQSIQFVQEKKSEVRAILVL